MARVKLELPDTSIFSTDIPVRISDINYAGHLGNDTVLSLIHESRVRLFRTRGYTELDIGGLGIIQADAVIVYKAEGFYGDVVTIDISFDDFNRYGFDMYYRLSINDGKKEIARAKTGIVFFNYGERKLAHVPPGFPERFGYTSEADST